MQNKKHMEDFDLFVKRSLQDAEMDVPPRVWKAIESKLDAAAAPHRGFRWAWVAVAAAAALAAAIIIPSTQNNSKLPFNTEERIALASPIQEIEIRQIPSPRTIKIQTRLQEEKPETDTKQRVQENAGTTAQNAETTAKKAETTAPSTETTEKQNKAELPPKQQYTVATEEAFAGMESDEVKSKREVTRLSAYVNSSIGGNETAAKGAATASASNPSYIENDIKENSASNYSIPLSFGAGVRIHLSDKLAIGTGIDFSFLSRSFTGLYNPIGEIPVVGDIRHDMQYIGIPVSIFYNIYNGKGFRFYIHGLGEAEWCVGNSYTMRATGQTVSEKIAGTQFSLGAGIGVEFRLSKMLGIYIDPSARYYFDAAHPNNVRSERPFMGNFNTGLRFNF